MPHDPQLIDARTLGSVPEIVVFDCLFNLSDPGWGERVYREGHLPGARFADFDRDLSSPVGPTTGRHPLPDAAALARTPGGGNARRGFQAWSAMGGDLTAGLPQPQPRRFEPQVNDVAWVTSAELVAGLAENRFQVIDARAPVRFRGESEPIDPVPGHIPGAVNLPLQGNLTADGRILSPGQLRARFLATLGERRPSAAVHACGSGVNACHNVLAMEVAGLAGSKLYAGS